MEMIGPESLTVGADSEASGQALCLLKHDRSIGHQGATGLQHEVHRTVLRERAKAFSFSDRQLPAVGGRGCREAGGLFHSLKLARVSKTRI